MPKKGFIPPVCPDVLVDVKEAYSSVYICIYIYGQSESNRMQLCVYSEDRETDSSP